MRLFQSEQKKLNFGKGEKECFHSDLEANVKKDLSVINKFSNNLMRDLILKIIEFINYYKANL